MLPEIKKKKEINNKTCSASKMTGKGLCNQTGGTHPFSSSASLYFVAYNILHCLNSAFSSSSLSFPIDMVYLVPPFCSSQVPTVTLIVYHPLDPQSLSLSTWLASCFSDVRVL